jgi:hypothetical protein
MGVSKTPLGPQMVHVGVTKYCCTALISWSLAIQLSTYKLLAIHITLMYPKSGYESWGSCE